MPNEEAVFSLAYTSGTILLLRLDAVTGLIHSSELKQESIVPRFLSGIATALRGRIPDVEVAVSLIIYTYDSDIYLFSLSREGRLRMWSCKKNQCITMLDLVSSPQAVTRSILNYGMKKTVNPKDEVYLCTYLKFDTGSEFNVLKLTPDSGLFKIGRLCTLLAPYVSIINAKQF